MQFYIFKALQMILNHDNMAYMIGSQESSVSGPSTSMIDFSPDEMKPGPSRQLSQ